VLERLRFLSQEKVKREGKWRVRWVEGVVPLVVVREVDDEGGRDMKKEDSKEEER